MNSRDDGFGAEAAAHHAGTYVLSAGTTTRTTEGAAGANAHRARLHRAFETVDVTVLPTCSCAAFRLGSARTILFRCICDVFTGGEPAGLPGISVPRLTAAGPPIGPVLLPPLGGSDNAAAADAYEAASPSPLGAGPI
jgi:Asp-tRNA(Asn)/Glu-tRNA(Gln) amidotransferase A subunit family amidase